MLSKEDIEQKLKESSEVSGSRHDPLVSDDTDMVNHPPHYPSHPSGVECIQITEHMGFCIGNAMKYLWRADLKADALEDLEKAKWYIEREIAKRKDSVCTN